MTRFKRNLVRNFSCALFLILASTSYSAAKEGVNTKIDSSRLVEMQAWLNNAKIEIQSGLAYLDETPVDQQEVAARKIIDNVLATSQGKNEYLTRNILYRAVKIHDVLLKVEPEAKRNAMARRILKETLAKSLKYCQMDLSLIEKANTIADDKFLRPVEFAALGVNWSNYVLGITYLIPTNESRLAILTDALGLLYNDLLDDSQYNRLMAPVAGHIAIFNEQQKNLPSSTNLERLARVRDIRHFLENELRMSRELLATVMKEDALRSGPAVASSTTEPAKANVSTSDTTPPRPSVHGWSDMVACKELATHITDPPTSIEATVRCIEKFKSQVNVYQCMDVAASTRTTAGEIKAKKICFNYFVDYMNPDVCNDVASKLVTNEAEEVGQQECFNRHYTTVGPYRCSAMAAKARTTASENALHVKCFNYYEK